MALIPGMRTPQNKKYLCAIDSFSAGSQTRSSPSALIESPRFGLDDKHRKSRKLTTGL
jgi:hypothetical protein